MSDCCSTATIEVPIEPRVAGRIRTVALIGPPNSGKSTLFNRLTGLRQKVANYPGVTVEQRMGLMAGVGRDDLTLIDLPGIYSLTPTPKTRAWPSMCCAAACPARPSPTRFLLVLDSLHLTRQLMLAAPVLAVGLPTLVLLNMSDLMESRGGKVDTLNAGARAGRAGGADQRRQRHRPRRRSAFSISRTARENQSR
jgi:ferrous iron transport protein B